MRIYFGTNRNPDNPEKPSGFGIYPSQKGLTDLRFGWADVNDNDHEDFSIFVAPENLEAGKEKAARKDYSDQVLGSRLVFDMVKAEMTNSMDCIIYIHGYNVDFKDAIKATADLKKFYADHPAVLFCFTWPSDGSNAPTAYSSDRDDARISGAALGRGIMKLYDFIRGIDAKDSCNKKLHLMAHSMGNYALRYALQYMIKSYPDGLRKAFDQIFLFAADEDNDAFEHDHKLKRLPDIAKRINVYHNEGDVALKISDTTKGNPDRLGTDGPRNSRLLPDKVTVINCNDVIDGIVEHSYYLDSKTVRNDVLAVLKGKAPGEIAGREYQVDTRSYKLK